MSPRSQYDEITSRYGFFVSPGTTLFHFAAPKHVSINDRRVAQVL